MNEIHCFLCIFFISIQQKCHFCGFSKRFFCIFRKWVTIVGKIFVVTTASILPIFPLFVASTTSQDCLPLPKIWICHWTMILRLTMIAKAQKVAVNAVFISVTTADSQAIWSQSNINVRLKIWVWTWSCCHFNISFPKRFLQQTAHQSQWQTSQQSFNMIQDDLPTWKTMRKIRDTMPSRLST